MRFRNLGSGSSGNATVIEARSGTQVSRLLVDCGFGIRQLQTRLAMAALTGHDIDAVFITHEHADHIGCAAQFAQQFNKPIWTSRGTHSALPTPLPEGCWRVAADGVAVSIGALEFTPFTVPHDAREPLQLHCTDGQRKMAVLTDLGHASAHVLENLQLCHALLLECNHDPALLAQSGYPPFLKARVSGRLGHLCNDDAAQIAVHIAHAGLGAVVAAHLSLQNNRPALAQQALGRALGHTPADIVTADAQTGTDWIAV